MPFIDFVNSGGSATGFAATLSKAVAGVSGVAGADHLQAIYDGAVARTLTMVRAIVRLTGAAPAGVCALLLAAGHGPAAAQVTTTGAFARRWRIRTACRSRAPRWSPRAEDAATTRVAVTGREGAGGAAGPEPFRPLRGDRRAAGVPDGAPRRRAGPGGTDRVAAHHAADRQHHRDRRGDGRAADRRRDQRGRGRGHHARPDRGGPHRRTYQSYLQLVPGRAPRRPRGARQSGFEVGPQLQRHRRRHERLARQLLLHRRHQRDRRR